MADWNSKTPLHCAAAAGFGEVAKILVEAKIDIKAEDENGKTAENIAEDVKEDEMAAFLKACATGKIPAKAPAAKVNKKYFCISWKIIFLGEGAKSFSRGDSH